MLLTLAMVSHKRICTFLAAPARALMSVKVNHDGFVIEKRVGVFVGAAITGIK